MRSITQWWYRIQFQWIFPHYLALLIVKYGELSSYPAFDDEWGNTHPIFVGYVAEVQYKDTSAEFLILRNQDVIEVYEMMNVKWRPIAKFTRRRGWIDWQYGSSIEYLQRVGISLDDVYRWKGVV